MFKWLKKKISIKNFVKGIKKVSRYIPGGDLIRAGIETAEEALRSPRRDERPRVEGQVFQRVPAQAGVRVDAQGRVIQAVGPGGGFGGLMPLLLIAAAAYFLMR